MYDSKLEAVSSVILNCYILYKFEHMSERIHTNNVLLESTMQFLGSKVLAKLLILVLFLF